MGETKSVLTSLPEERASYDNDLISRQHLYVTDQKPLHDSSCAL